MAASKVAASPAKNQLDIMFRQMLVFSKMFTKSWGQPEVLKLLREYQHKYAFQGAAMELIERDLPQMVIEKDEVKGNVQIQHGWFISPLDKLSPSFFDGAKNVAKACWRGYFPAPGRPRNGLVIHLAPTGDHTYWRREKGLVKPLLAAGVGSILLQNPFYGERKPDEQYQSSLRNVSDLYVMGGSLIVECCFLLRWVREQGHHPVGISGVSMGGYMSCLAASNVRDSPVPLVPLLSWTSAAPVFTQGALASAIKWDRLAKELEESAQLREMLAQCEWAEMMHDREHPAYKLFPNSPARRLMWILMEEFTNLGNYPVPLDTRGIHFVVAEEDAYVPRSEHIPDIERLWPGTSVNFIPGTGHVGAYFGHHKLFREKILNSLGLDTTVQNSTPVTDNAAPENGSMRNVLTAGFTGMMPAFLLERIGGRSNSEIGSEEVTK